MENNERVKKLAVLYSETTGQYSTRYEREKIIRDWLNKEEAAFSMVKDFEKRAGNLKGKKILELGFGSGLNLASFNKAGAIISGIEVNSVLLEIAKMNIKENMIEADLRLYNGNKIPYNDESFDYVLATSVLEHVSDVRGVMCEVYRVLKNGGKFYISFPNRLAPRETHTGFFFVQYFPRKITEYILKMFGSNAVKELNLNFLGFLTFKKHATVAGFKIVNDLDAKTVFRRYVKNFLYRIGLHYSIMLKTIMVVLEKK